MPQTIYKHACNTRVAWKLTMSLVWPRENDRHVDIQNVARCESYR